MPRGERERVELSIFGDVHDERPSPSLFLSTNLRNLCEGDKRPNAIEWLGDGRKEMHFVKLFSV